MITLFIDVAYRVVLNDLFVVVQLINNSTCKHVPVITDLFTTDCTRT